MKFPTRKGSGSNIGHDYPAHCGNIPNTVEAGESAVPFNTRVAVVTLGLPGRDTRVVLIRVEGECAQVARDAEVPRAGSRGNNLFSWGVFRISEKTAVLLTTYRGAAQIGIGKAYLPEPGNTSPCVVIVTNKRHLVYIPKLCKLRLFEQIPEI